MIEIVPSILVKTEQEFQEYFAKLEPLVQRVHVDIADGIFVPNTTIDGYPELQDIESAVAIDAHLMVSKPENHVPHWIDTPVDRIIFHIEATIQPQQVIDAIKDSDRGVGVALNPATPHEKIHDIVDQLDFVHFMTVEPGFNGSPFVPAVIEKIKDFHFLFPDVPISVDGGVTPEIIASLREAGVSEFVVGSYVHSNSDPAGALHTLRAAAGSIGDE